VQSIVTIDDSSNMLTHDVNVMTLCGCSDEFFFTLVVVHPPDQSEIEALTEDR
jgi:hypothetical protein